MFIYNENIIKISEETISALNTYTVSVLADAISAVNNSKNKVLCSRIHGVKQGLHFAGIAVTVKAPNGNLFPIQYALYKGFPGAVLCIDTNNHANNPYLGEMMAVTARGFGYQAIVIDGLIRDKAEIIAMNYPVFAVGTHPRPKAPVLGGEINVPIILDGAEVNPGDYIAGDDDGFVIISPEFADAVAAKAAEKFSADEARLANIIKYFELPADERDIYSTMGAGFAKAYKELE